MTVPDHHSCPEPHVGHLMAFRVFTVDVRLGLDLHRRSSIGTPSVSRMACIARARRTASPALQADLSIGACRAVWLDRYPCAARGLILCGWITAPSSLSDHYHQPDHRSVAGHPAVPTPIVAEPQTNGVAERFRSAHAMKEQIIHGRIYRNIAELRDAVRDFVELYNAQSRIVRKERRT